MKVFNLHGKEVGNIQLPEHIFNKEMNINLVKKVIVCQQSNARQGSASTKNRTAVHGSGRKMRPQKGTGRARMGEKNVPHHRGGAVAFGPNNRNYERSINKKEMQAATKILLSEKFCSDSIKVIDKLSLAEAFADPKLISTKKFVESMKKLGVNTNYCLIVDKDLDNNFVLSTRNVATTRLLEADRINPLTLFKSKYLIISKDAIEFLRGKYEKS